MFIVTEYAALRVWIEFFISQPKHILWVLKRTVSSWISCSDYKRHWFPISHILLIDNVINIKYLKSKSFFIFVVVFFGFEMQLWEKSVNSQSQPTRCGNCWMKLNVAYPKELKYITDHAEFDYFYVPSTIFQLCRDGSSWVEPVLS